MAKSSKHVRAASKSLRQTGRFLGQAKTSASRKKPATISQKLEKGEVAWYNQHGKGGSQQAQAKIMIDEDGMIVVVLVILGSILGVFAPSIIGHFWPYGMW